MTKARDFAMMIGRSEALNPDRVALLDGDAVSVTDSANVSSIIGTAGVTVYDSLGLLPTSSLTAGQQAFVNSNKRLYISNGSGWYNVAAINATPTLTLSSTGTIALTAGSATTITMTAADSDGTTPTLSLESGGDLFKFATVSQDSSVVTITPRTADSATSLGSDGSATLTFKASDGISVASVQNTFTLSFGPSGGNPLFYIEGESGLIKWGMTGQGSGTSVFSSLDISSGHIIIGAPAHDSNKGKVYLYSYTSSGATAIRTHVQTYYSFLGQQVAVNTTAGKYATGEQGNGGTSQGQLRVYNISDGSLAWDHHYNELSGGSTTQNWPGTWSDIQMTDSNIYIGHNGGYIRSFALSNGNQNYVITTPGSGGYFGADISVDESISRFITAEKDGGTSNRGEAYIYNTTNGSLVKTIANPEQASGSNYDQFGGGVALKGNYAIIGAPGEDTGAGAAGKVFLYTTSDNWANVTQVRSHAAPVAITNGNFGLYVEISDTHYYVSNFKEDNGGGGGLAGGGVSGVIYVYKISDGSLEFTLGKSADDFTSVQNGNFGVGLCLEGNSLLASQGNATWDPTYYPRAYVFE